VPELIYFAIASLDGYIEDERGQFGWAAPDEEVHAFVNDLIRPVGTFLYGRRMYETMVAWESVRDGPPVIRDFADIWRNAEKVVFSRTLASVSSERTRIVGELVPDSVRAALAEGAGPAAIGGAEIASAALSAGLVDEYHLLIAPYVAGNGKAALPAGMSLRLELLDQTAFEGGMVYLRYRVEPGP
jgi:dihydrofolate reductase